MRYAIMIERTNRNYAAHAPDVPGCIATGATINETVNNLRDALQLHFAGMREDGDPIPDPSTLFDYVDVNTYSTKNDGKPETVFRRQAGNRLNKARTAS